MAIASPPQMKIFYLQFCFHDLSPRKIGATLAWCLVEPNAEELESMQPRFTLKQIQARVGDKRSLSCGIC